jgi:hypothetical protein
MFERFSSSPGDSRDPDVVFCFLSSARDSSDRNSNTAMPCSCTVREVTRISPTGCVILYSNKLIQDMAASGSACHACIHPIL